MIMGSAHHTQPCTAGGFSSSWSTSFDEAWRRLVAKAKQDHQAPSLVDFHWRRARFPQWLEKASAQSAQASSSSGHSTHSHAATSDEVRSACGERSDAVTARAIPMDFEFSRAEGWSNRDGWRLVIGAATSGTCFRSAAPAALRRRDEQWRRNAIANLFHCPVEVRGQAVLHVVRHGVVGFSKEPGAHVTSHLELTLRHVIGEQLKSRLPMRVVSINLLSHYKASGEPDMLERQLAAFQEVLRRINSKGLHILSRCVWPAIRLTEAFSLVRTWGMFKIEEVMNGFRDS